MPAPFWKQPSSSGSMSPSRSPRSVTGSNSSQQAPFVNPNPHGGQKRAAGKVYVPRIYGFKVSERAKSGPRMQWMRLRPESPEDLDEVDWKGRWIDDEEDQYDDGIDGEAEEDRRMEDFDPVRRVIFYCTMLIIDIWNRTMLMMTTTMTRRRRKRKKKLK
jgi:casein kinase II subunit beta